MYNHETNRIYNELLAQKHSFTGGIYFQLGGINIEIKGKDGIGGIIEEWFGEWAQKNRFNVTRQVDSQVFPDYYVNTNSLLEIKTFNSLANPSFDIANFESYCESVSNTPSRAESDYLIFSYLSHNGKISIKDIWLKKIWEITCNSAKDPLKNQTKRNVIYNIRPATWYKKTQFDVFKSKEEFINALFQTQKNYTGYDFKERYLLNLQRGL
jgi:hypothetical protein